jgi:hypothetical protein
MEIFDLAFSGKALMARLEEMDLCYGRIVSKKKKSICSKLYRIRWEDLKITDPCATPRPFP